MFGLFKKKIYTPKTLKKYFGRPDFSTKEKCSILFCMLGLFDLDNSKIINEYKAEYFETLSNEFGIDVNGLDMQSVQEFQICYAILNDMNDHKKMCASTLFLCMLTYPKHNLNSITKRETEFLNVIIDNSGFLNGSWQLAFSHFHSIY